MTGASPMAAWHRTIWRWHFWAGLIVAPFLLILSLTGAIYLFNDEVNDALYPGLRRVADHATSVPMSRMVRAALAACSGTVSRIDLPEAGDRSVVLFMTPLQGPARQVYVDPGTGRVLGSLVYDDTLVGMAETLHGTLMLGAVGDRIVEMAACWALVLLVTGAILWWPRGPWQATGVIWPRLSGRGRRFWRDLHGPVGIWSGALIGFLVLTGLPWSGVAGERLQRAITAAGVGYPATFRTINTPNSVPMKTALGHAPWTLESAPMPRSHATTDDPHAGHAGHMSSVTKAEDGAAIAGLDRVTALLATRGWNAGYRLFPPTGPTGVYTAYTYPDRPDGQRTIYVDRYTYRPIGREVRFADYGWAGRGIEWGVQLHMGNAFGRANQIVMLVPCIAIWLLTISGVVMWWKRRPAGRIGAPRPMAGARMRGLLVTLVLAGLLLPVFGVSLLLLGAIDWLVTRVGRGAT